MDDTDAVGVGWERGGATDATDTGADVCNVVVVVALAFVVVVGSWHATTATRDIASE
jgi:hypothetical protein